jgi:O-antigen ligase
MSTVWSGSRSSQNVVAASAVESEEDRLGALNRAIHYTLEHPVFGLGLGNFEIASGTELGRPEDWIGAHNTFAQISSEAGVPALALFISLLWTAIRRMKTLSQTIVDGPETFDLKLMARATLVSVSSFAFGAFFAHIGYDYFLYYPVAIAVGVQYLSRTIETASGSKALSLIPGLQVSAMDGSS